MADKVELNLNLLSHQADYFDLIFGANPVPFPLLVGGYGCGKTRTIVAATIKLQIKYKGIPWAIFEPTYGDIRDIMIPALDSFCDEYRIPHSYNKQSSIYVTPFGKIYLKSMHEPDSIVGFEVGGAFADELDTMAPDKAKRAWDKIIARARIPLPDGSPNIVGAATTPEGFGFCYKQWVENDSPLYQRVHGKTITSLNAGFISKSYVENLIASYTKELQKAYLEGLFVNLNAATFYYGYSEENVMPIKIDPSLDISLCFDFNVDPAVAAIVQDRGREDIRVIDTVYLPFREQGGVGSTKAVCRSIKNKLEGFTDLRVNVYGDASGLSRDTRSNVSDYAIIEEELSVVFDSFSFQLPSKNPGVKDRENAVNNSLQKNHITIDPRCKPLINDFRKITRKGNEMDKSDSDLTHISDAFGYFVSRKYPIIRERRHRGARQL